MKITNKLFTLIFLLALLAAPTQSVHAKGLTDGRVVFGSNYTLESGDTLTGDLVVIGGNAVVEEGATVTGDLVVVGGSLTLDGIVDGTSVLVGGSASLGSTSVVGGDLVTVGGSLQQAPGARVDGDVITNIPAPDIRIPDVQVPDGPIGPGPQQPPNVNVDFGNPLAQAVQMFFTAVAVAALAMVASLFLQPQIERVASAITGQPLIAGSFGLLTLVAAPFVLLVMAITLILIPVAVLAAVALALAWLFGVIAIGMEVGERFTRAINQTWAPALTIGFGTFLTMLVVGAIGMLPCFGWLAPFLVALVGIGGVVLTLFGSRSYPRVAMPVAPPSQDEPVG